MEPLKDDDTLKTKPAPSWRWFLLKAAGGIATLILIPLLLWWVQKILDKQYFDGSGSNEKESVSQKQHDRLPTDKEKPLPEAAREEPRLFFSAEELLRTIAADLEAGSEDGGKSRRYLTLVHLWNQPALKMADLEAARAAVADLIEILSPPGQRVALESVGSTRTIFRIDLKELEWMDEGQWQAILKEYPYGLHCPEKAAPARQAAEEKLKTLTGSELCYLRGDWLVARAPRPPLGGTQGALRIKVVSWPASVKKLGDAYASQELTLPAAAADLGLTDAKALAAQLKRSARLKELQPLLQDKTITRREWESLDAKVSPFQEVSRLLRIGTPFRVQ